jgi:hypothetical protein
MPTTDQPLNERIARQIAVKSNRTDTPRYYVSWVGSVLDAARDLGYTLFPSDMLDDTLPPADASALATGGPVAIIGADDPAPRVLDPTSRAGHR